MAKINPVNVFLLLNIVLCAVIHVSAKPRDITALQANDKLQDVEDGTALQAKDPLSDEHGKPTKDLALENTTKDEANPGVTYHGPVACDTEEDTEDPICQEHCLPKGYTYGLCISKKCTCV